MSLGRMASKGKSGEKCFASVSFCPSKIDVYFYLYLGLIIQSKAGVFCLPGPCSCIPSLENSLASVGNASSLSCAWFVHFLGADTV